MHHQKKQFQKKKKTKVATWNSAHQTKKWCNFDSGSLER